MLLPCVITWVCLVKAYLISGYECDILFSPKNGKIRSSPKFIYANSFYSSNPSSPSYSHCSTLLVSYLTIYTYGLCHNFRLVTYPIDALMGLIVSISLKEIQFCLLESGIIDIVTIKVTYILRYFDALVIELHSRPIY